MQLVPYVLTLIALQGEKSDRFFDVRGVSKIKCMKPLQWLKEDWPATNDSQLAMKFIADFETQQSIKEWTETVIVGDSSQKAVRSLLGLWLRGYWQRV